MKYHSRFINRTAAVFLLFIYLISIIPSVFIFADTAITDIPTDTPDSANEFIWPTGPSIYADSAIVMEASTGLILYEKDIYSKYYPASITKIMTTLLALENCNLNETMTMSHEAEWDVDFNSSRIGLVEGEQISLEDALYAVMLESANEVSYGVAEHVAKGTVADFAAMMNARAKELGCKNTNFVNPHGLHDDNHYTCAYDMALIGKAAINLPEFRKITGTRTYQIPATNKNVLRYLANHHRFIRKTLNYDGTIGGKTGGTEEAKTTLVTFAERDGLLLIAVVLHVDTALHAYEDTSKILDFGFENYSLYTMEQTETTNNTTFPSLFTKASPFEKESTPLLRISKNSNVVLPNTANFNDAKKSVILTPIEEFVHGDNIIGKIAYTFADKYVGFADIIYYNADYPLTKSEFESRWPSYLIPPNVEFTDTGTVIIPTIEPTAAIDIVPTQELAQKEDITSKEDTSSKEDITSKEDNNDKKKEKSSVLPLILGIIAAIIVILIGLYIIFIEVPHRRKRKLYKERHRQRMESISSRDNFIE